LGVFSQGKEIDWEAVDSLYREDQFYMHFSYNSLQNRPGGINQKKISFGLGLGFLRDIPINKMRTLAIAPGFGYSLAIYNHNLGIFSENGQTSYQVLTDYSKNKQTLHYLDFPIEFRWRNSTFQSNKFWRVYPGFKVSYMFYDRYKRETPTETVKMYNLTDLNKVQYGVSLAVGWNTWNFYAYYGLNPIFKSSATLNGEHINMHTANLGLMFYIL
jgi:hypothetical protein